MIKLDLIMNNVENKLAVAAAAPVVGALPCGALVTIGAVQTLSAFFSTFATVPISLVKRDKKWAAYSMQYIQHGFGNIVGGVTRAIPLVGTALWWYSNFKVQGFSQGLRLIDANDKKYMPYRSLDKYHWKFDGGVEGGTAEVTQIYHELIKNQPNLTPAQKYDLAASSIKMLWQRQKERLV